MVSRRKRKRERQKREASENKKRNEDTRAEATALHRKSGGAADVLDVAQLEDKKRQFLAAFQECASVTQAAEIAGISHQSHYNWLASDPRYKALYYRTRENVGDILESVVINHAVHGTEKPVFYLGQLVATVQEFDARLQLRVLQRFRPEYREQQKIGITNAIQTNVYQDSDSSTHGNNNPADVIRIASEHDPDILDFIRARGLAEDSDPSAVREDGEQRTLEDGAPSRGT